MIVSVPDTEKNWLQRQAAKWKRDVASVLFQARTLTLLLRHARTPWRARLVAGCAVAYLLSPVQLIPTFIPVIGQMDDLFVLFLGMKLVRKLTPGMVLAECEEHARSSAFVNRVACKPALQTESLLGIR